MPDLPDELVAGSVLPWGTSLLRVRCFYTKNAVHGLVPVDMRQDADFITIVIRWREYCVTFFGWNVKGC